MANSSYYDFHCPIGGTWYACATGSKFIGCCTSDPCTTGCVQGNIRSGAYNVSHHGEWPDASCGTASNFFTCNAGNSFWGCCKSNPCAATPPSTCPQGNLVPAFMDRPEQFSAYASASSTAAPSSSSNTAAIAGGVVGGVVALAIIGALLFFFLRRKRRAQEKEYGERGAAAMPMISEKRNGRTSAQYSGQSPPPTYSSPNPNQEYYRDNDPSKGPYQNRYANVAGEPQELPADISYPTEQRPSELPAEASSSTGTHRYSELPAGTRQTSELETPEATPQPRQAEFSRDLAKQANQGHGLGVTTEEASKNH